MQIKSKGPNPALLPIKIQNDGIQFILTLHQVLRHRIYPSSLLLYFRATLYPSTSVFAGKNIYWNSSHFAFYWTQFLRSIETFWKSLSFFRLISNTVTYLKFSSHWASLWTSPIHSDALITPLSLAILCRCSPGTARQLRYQLNTARDLALGIHRHRCVWDGHASDTPCSMAFTP